MKLKLFLEGLEPGSYPGALVIDTDGEITFRPGETVINTVTDTVGAVSHTNTETRVVYKPETEFAVIPTPFVSPITQQMGRATRDVGPTPIVQDFATVGTTKPLDPAYEHRRMLTSIAAHLCAYPGPDTDKFVNGLYAVLAFINERDKALHDLRANSITLNENFVAKSAYERVKKERDSARATNSAYYQTSKDFEQRLADAKRTILDAADEMALAVKELDARQACLDATAISAVKWENEARTSRDVIEEMKAQLIEVRYDLKVARQINVDHQRSYEELQVMYERQGKTIADVMAALNLQPSPRVGDVPSFTPQSAKGAFGIIGDNDGSWKP